MGQQEGHCLSRAANRGKRRGGNPSPLRLNVQFSGKIFTHPLQKAARQNPFARQPSLLQ